MTQCHLVPIKIRKDLLKVFKKYLDFKKYKIFFFGSRVSGLSAERSDLDIGIEGSRPLPASLKLELEEALDELPILYKIDVVDFRKVPKKFKKEALKHIEILN